MFTSSYSMTTFMTSYSMTTYMTSYSMTTFITLYSMTTFMTPFSFQGQVTYKTKKVLKMYQLIFIVELLVDVNLLFCIEASGIKRQQWSPDEMQYDFKAFKKQICEKKIASTEEIRSAKATYDTLRDRSETVFRTRLNRIILVKSHMYIINL